jgi:hypothetical protein
LFSRGLAFLLGLSGFRILRDCGATGDDEKSREA